MAGIHMLQTIAEGLDDLLDEVVFVGGATVDLYCTAPHVGGAHITDDVDIVIEIVSISDYYDFETQLREHGFVNDIDSGLIIRWQFRGLTVDVMPSTSIGVGPANDWYSPGILTAIQSRLPNSTTIRIFDPPHFVASKLAALQNRGWDGLRWSKDWEDLVRIILLRPSLCDEINQTAPETRAYIKSSFQRVLAHEDFDEATSILADDLHRFPTSTVREIMSQVINS